MRSLKLMMTLFLLGGCQEAPESTNSQVANNFNTPIPNNFNMPIPGEMVEMWTEDTGMALPYHLYVPEDYNGNANDYPTLLFLHGIGGRGINLGRTNAGVPQMITDGDDFPFIIIMPQCPQGSLWFQVNNEVKEVLDYESTQRRIIDTKIYVSGFSMGGFGTYDIVNAFPYLFAAALPLNGKGNPDFVSNYLQTPFWIFNGDADSMYLDDHNTFDLMRQIGTYARFTTYIGAGHTPLGYEDEKIWDWMLAQERGTPHNYEIVMEDGTSQYVEPGTTINISSKPPEGYWLFDSWSSTVGASSHNTWNGFTESSGSSPAIFNNIYSSSTYIITAESDSIIASSHLPDGNQPAVIDDMTADFTHDLSTGTSFQLWALATDYNHLNDEFFDDWAYDYQTVFWEQISGPAGQISFSPTNNSMSANVSPGMTGTYVMRATTTDDLGAAYSKDITITVVDSHE
jgi:predicted esterase